MVLGGGITVAVMRQRVEADEHGLAKIDLRTRSFAWDDIADIRPDSPAPWGQELVLVTTTGEVVKLGLDHRETGPVDAWQRRVSRG